MHYISTSYIWLNLIIVLAIGYVILAPPEYITTRDRTRRQALTSDYLAEISQYDTVYLVSNPGPLYELFGVEETLVFGDNMIYYNNYSGEAPNRIKCRGKEPINEMTRIAVNPILTQYYSPTAESDYDYHNRSIMDATDHSRLIIAVRKDNGYEITSTEIIEEWLAGEPSYYKQLHDRILENAANGLYGCKEAPKTHGD